MSILDGKVVLAGESLNGDNRNNRQEKRNKKNRFSNRENNRRDRKYGDDDFFDFSNSSYLPEDERVPSSKKDGEVSKEDPKAREIYEFIDEFVDNVNNYRSLQDILIEKLPDVIPYMMKGYYSQKSSPALIDALNKFLKIICQTQFAKTLKSVLESGVWSDDVYDEIWRSIAYALSIALETNHTRMHTDVIKTYATEILPRMWKPEIMDIVHNTGVTSDLALDLIIAIPVFGGTWNGTNIDIFYDRFLSKILIHADDNIDVINWEIQGQLYEKFFGKSNTALKVVGKYLTCEPVKTESSSVQAVYDEFRKMLYSKLDDYDIKDIEYVFEYVMKFREKNPDKEVIFDSREASKFENVKKGLLSIMDKNPDAMKFLA